MISFSNHTSGSVEKIDNEAFHGKTYSHAGKSESVHAQSNVRWSQSRPAGITGLWNSITGSLLNGLIGAYNRGNVILNSENLKSLSVNSEPPFMRFSEESGFVEGDKFLVDGPLWYDGDGYVDRLDEAGASFRLNIRAPSIASRVFKIVDKKIDISVGIGEFDNGKVVLTLTDHNDNDRVQRAEGTIEEGVRAASGGWFGNDMANKYYAISTDIGKLDLIILQKEKVQLHLQIPPYLDNRFDLTKI